MPWKKGSQDSFSTINLLLFWTNECSEPESFISRNTDPLSLSQKGFEIPALENITFPIISLWNVNICWVNRRVRARRKSFSYPYQHIYYNAFARRCFSMRNNFYDINCKKMMGIFCLHPSWLVLTTVKNKPIVKKRYLDIPENQAAGKLQIC